MSDQITKVGIGVAIFKGTDILVGIRKGSHGQGEIALPGGHMDYMESFRETAMREMAEEIGPQVVVKNLQIVSVINLVEYAPKHYIDIGMACEWVSGEPIVMEPHKCEAWVWEPVEKVLQGAVPMFKTVARIIRSASFIDYDGVAVFDKE